MPGARGLVLCLADTGGAAQACTADEVALLAAHLAALEALAQEPALTLSPLQPRRPAAHLGGSI